MTEIKFRYFACNPGHVVPRWGVRDSYIGAHRTKDGYVWHEKEIAAIPVNETIAFHREYTRCLKDGALEEKKKADFDDFVKWQAEESSKDAKAREDKTGETPKKKGSSKSASGSDNKKTG